MTRAERLHNLLCRLFQVAGVSLVVGSFFAGYHSALQWTLVLAGLLLVVIAAAMGRYVEEDVDV